MDRAIDPLQTIDAKLWADEFMATKQRLGDAEFDHAMMLGWFANAIMRGYDEGKRLGAADAQATIAALQARVKELERVRGELDHAKKMEAVQKEVADNQTWHVQKLRTLILALPKVEGAVVVSNGYVKDSTRCHALFGADEDAALYAALLQHRQGMEG